MEAVKKEGSGLKILELGCDDGSFAYGFAQLGNKVTAIDLDCSKARNIHPHENIEYDDEFYVYCQNEIAVLFEK